jgi:DNA helicase-2/ATP-dependent DNA helicase PcrA
MPANLDEARFVVEEIRELVRDGISPTQIALLYRSNAQSRVLENELFTKNVPYKVYGGLRFFERQEIKHALAYLRLLGNPDDDTAFLRVVNFPTRGIGARSLENLQATAHQTNSSLYNAAASLTGKSGQTVGAFIRLIEQLRVETEGLPLPEMVEHIIEKSGLAQHYRTDKEGQDRLENLDELINAAATFIDDEGAIGEGGALVSFLTLASLEAGEHGFHHRPGAGAVSARKLDQCRQGRAGGGASADVCGGHPRPSAPLRFVCADPHAAWPDALLRAVEFPR